GGARRTAVRPRHAHRPQLRPLPPHPHGARAAPGGRAPPGPRPRPPPARLPTATSTQEFDEVKTMLINQGYPEATVHRFFSPLSHRNVDVVDKQEESRRFYDLINRT